MPSRCKRCGTEPKVIRFGEGWRIECEECGTAYWHGDFTREQIERIWDYRQEVEDERLLD